MRITGGELRSRALKAPRGTETRPTSDRVREALFSMLVSADAFGEGRSPRVLDVFAGSGALAFEALSRGAEHAVLVDHAAPAVAVIRENARALGVASNVTVVPQRIERALASPALAGPFDLVFCDPPYADVRTPSFVAVLATLRARLGEGGLLVVEHASRDAPPEVPGTSVHVSRRYGDTTVTIYAAAETS
jgi:16S rRNA (guanine966-N2)-methyltransferase